MSTACPKCGHVNDDATEANGGEFLPSAGDVSICLYCCALAIFTGDGLNVRGTTQDERDALLRDPAVVRALLTIASFQAAHPEIGSGG